MTSTVLGGEGEGYAFTLFGEQCQNDWRKNYLTNVSHIICGSVNCWVFKCTDKTSERL